ncbi:hypothetical protein NMG60_11018045 [Bertholletia excelsa]
MEVEEMEAVMEKIWDLHDKLSDAIHSISRAHYINSIKSLRKSGQFLISGKKKPSNNKDSAHNNNNNGAGYVFAKDCRLDEDDDDVDYFPAIQEAKSLNAIRTALENLEDQFEFFNTLQIQQRAERDAAFARLEQSRIALAKRLADHQGKKYKVVDEAWAFVGNACDMSRFVASDHLYGTAACPSDRNFECHQGKRSNNPVGIIIPVLNFAKSSLKLDQVGGILGNAALVAISMLALVDIHQVACKEKYQLTLPHERENDVYNRNVRKDFQLEGASSSGGLTQLNVMLARG